MMTLLKSAVAALALAFMAQPCQSQSLEAMESGAAAVVMASSNQKLTGAQLQSALRFSSYVRGFLGGMTAAPITQGNPGEAKLIPPEDWLYDPVKAAPSFLTFVQKRKPQDYDPKAPHGKFGFLITALVMEQTPKRTSYQDIMIDVLVKEFFTPPPEERK